MPKGTKQPKEATVTDVLVAINGFANDIEERFATKEDLHKALQPYATKADLCRELQQYATKADLQAYSTKEDLKQTENRLMVVLDKILVNTERLETERVAYQAWLQRHDEQFKRLLPQV